MSEGTKAMLHRGRQFLDTRCAESANAPQRVEMMDNTMARRRSPSGQLRMSDTVTVTINGARFAITRTDEWHVSMKMEGGMGSPIVSHVGEFKHQNPALYQALMTWFKTGTFPSGAEYSGPSYNQIRMEYNGWTNRETWNVCLWIFGDEAIYNSFRAEQTRVGTFTPVTAENFVRGLWPSGTTPDGDVLRNANWAEVSEAFNEHQ